ncbi:MAG: hypothetical protein K8R85_01485 [Bacteroidetes bacterium]|nr:hypothetical protein [Bacteroidota bacterium]
MVLTAELIQSKLFNLYLAAHKLHLDTRSYSQHKALGELYEGLLGFTDSISEILMGYQGGKRIGKLMPESPAIYSLEAVDKLIEDVLSFSYELYEWAETKKYCDVENKAQDLSGLFASTKYKLTLS